MIDMRIRGKTLKEVALEYGVSVDTVERTLSWAKKAELVVQAEDKILNELVPAAHAALAAVLKGENDEVKARTALEIFKGSLPSFSKRGQASPTGASNGTDLSSYIANLRGAAGELDGVVEGHVEPPGALPDPDSRSTVGLLAAGETSLPAEGLPSPDSLLQRPLNPA